MWFTPRLPSCRAIAFAALVVAVGPAGCGGTASTAVAPKSQDHKQVDSDMEKAAQRNKEAVAK